jgi:hypothetical protein
LRDELFHEYTNQLIFSHPSEYWVFAKSTGSKYEVPYELMLRDYGLTKYEDFNP